MSEDRIEVGDGKYVVTLRSDRASEKSRNGISSGIPTNMEYLLACEVRDLRAKLAAFDWVAGLYDERELTRDDVAAELADYQVLLERVPSVYCHATGGLLSKPNYDVHVMTSAIDDHIQRLVDDEVKEALANAEGQRA